MKRFLPLLLICFMLFPSAISAQNAEEHSCYCKYTPDGAPNSQEVARYDQERWHVSYVTDWKKKDPAEVIPSQELCQDFCKDVHDGLNKTGTFISASYNVELRPNKPPTIPILGFEIPGLGNGLKDPNDPDSAGFDTPILVNGVLEVNFLGQYINAIYTMLVGVMSVVAVIMIIVGGIQYMLSAGAGEAKEAIKRIQMALIGFVILIGSYMILQIVNPSTTFLPPISLGYVQSVPLENLIHANEGITCGGSFDGVNQWQDCMLRTYGGSERELELVEVTTSKGRTYRVHKDAAVDFQAAFDTIANTAPDYDISLDSAGGTFNFRCNANNPRALSSHSWGTAIDINPSTNPNCRGLCSSADNCSCIGGNNCLEICVNKSHDIPPAVVAAFKANNFFWGGDYTNVKDYMHFDYTKVCKH